MELSQVVKKRETAAPNMRREGWGEGGTAPFFLIASVDKDLAEKIDEESVDLDRPWKTEKEHGFRPKKVRNVNDDLRTENHLFHSVVGWEEFTLEHLTSLVSLEYSVSLTGLDTKTPIEFSPGNRRFVAQAASTQFRAWAFTVGNDIAAFHAENEESQTKNFSSTSAGG